MSDELISQANGRAHFLTLNRPERRNALTPDLARALATEIGRIGENGKASLIVLRGRGGHFCVGLDLRWLAALGASPSRQQLADGLQDFQASVRAVAHSPLPVVALLEGSVAGFGFDLALACDVRLATESLTVSSAFARMGLVPDGGSTFTLPRVMGVGRAVRMLTSCETLTAAAALELGIVDEVVADTALEPRVAALADAIAVSARSSVATIKRLCRATEIEAFEAALEREAEAQLRALQGHDFQERLAAFVARPSTR